jgi:hypothetical protein
MMTRMVRETVSRMLHFLFGSFIDFSRIVANVDDYHQIVWFPAGKPILFPKMCDLLDNVNRIRYIALVE